MVEVISVTTEVSAILHNSKMYYNVRPVLGLLNPIQILYLRLILILSTHTYLGPPKGSASLRFSVGKFGYFSHRLANLFLLDLVALTKSHEEYILLLSSSSCDFLQFIVELIIMP